jgi:hypothetical protein
MSLLVLSYPNISEKDFNWIQAVRANHDELYYKVVAPHFTIVFPNFNQDKVEFVEHAKLQARCFKKIDFVLRCAIIVKDAFNDYTHLFLVPDEGYSEIVKLHDKLYDGPLAPELRLDIPFIPHIGIGNAIDPFACKKLADELNRKAFEINGRIETLDVTWYEENKVETLERIELG